MIVLAQIPWLLVVAGLLWMLFSQQTRHGMQVSELLQRIQAPEVAVAQHVHATEDAEGLGYVPLDDDDRARENYQELIGVAAD